MDDAYIHMGVAKNWLLNGSIGINEKGWTSLTSSPLYTFLLILLLKVSNFSDQILWPLALAVWAAFALTMGSAFRRYGFNLGAYQLYIFLVAACLPITYAFLNGMEHIIHVWLTSLLLVHWQGNIRQESAETSNSHLALIGICAALAILTRFETLFLTGTLTVIDVYEGRYRRAAVLVLATALPPLAFMIWMHSHGADFIPASISVKSTLDTSSLQGFVHKLGVRVVRNIALLNHFWIFATAASVIGLVALQYVRTRDRALRPLLAACGCTVAGYVLTPLEDTNRYEMWLLSLMILAIVQFGMVTPRCSLLKIMLIALPLACLTAILAVFSFKIPLIVGSLVLSVLWIGFAWTKDASREEAILAPFGLMIVTALVWRLLLPLPSVCRLGGNINGQQRTFARFLKAYYDGRPVVLNDIGTTAFYTSCPIIDRAGLATQAMVPAVKRLNKGFKAGFPESLDSVAKTQQAQLAIVYPAWLQHIPPRWIPVGSFITQPVLNLLGDSVVTVYAFDRAEAARARRCLEAFAPSIPANTRLVFAPERNCN